MRALIIDSHTKAAIARVRDFAQLPENYYEPGKSLVVPGNDERYVCRLLTYRCVFTISRSQAGLFRHLSISVPGDKYPHPFAVFTIADMFGFIGWDGKTWSEPPPGWIFNLDRMEGCLAVFQPYLTGKPSDQN